MKKRNILTAALSLALVAVIAVGATLAYFTAQTDAVHNTFTTGNIEIAVVDETAPAAGEVGGVKDPATGNIAYGTETPIMPGDVISKQVSVSVDANSQPAWVALKLTVNATPSADSELTVDEAKAAVKTLIDREVAKQRAWVEDENNEGIYYYRGIVQPGDTAASIFTTLTIRGEEWDNDYAGMSFSISVEAAAVQAANIDTIEAAKPELGKLFGLTAEPTPTPGA